MIKTTPDMIVSGGAILWSVCLPLFPDTIFTLLDNVVGVLVLLLVALMAFSPNKSKQMHLSL
jgi:uncharacterized membrane protein YgaE (UPF0421/DUF939 family)